MAAHAQQSRSYANAPEFYRNLIRAIDTAGLNLSLKSENVTPTGVWYRILHGMSAKSYGEKITVTIIPVAGGTQIDIYSECGLPTQIFDGGKNASNVRAIFEYLERAQPVVRQHSAPAAPGPAAIAAQAPSVPRVAPAEGYFCPLCGAPAAQDAKFCPLCGTKLAVQQPVRFCGSCGAKL